MLEGGTSDFVCQRTNEDLFPLAVEPLYEFSEIQQSQGDTEVL